MKKILTALIICVLALTALTSNVYAKGYIKPSRSSLTITKGSSGTFTVTASNAAGRVDISTSNSSVATVNRTNAWLDNNSVTVKVTGKAVGTATITVRLTDAATFDKETLSSTYRITVKVTEPKSSNNNLSSISVDGYKLVKVSDTVYTLDVGNSVSKITIKATAADSKATVAGTGAKTLNTGLNTFNVVVTAESGAKKTYVIKVSRKDGYYLEDLDEALKTAEPTIKLRDGDKLTTVHLDKIKASGKKVMLNASDKEGNVIYSWDVDGTKLSTYTETNTDILFDSLYTEQIDALSNYAKGLHVRFEQTGTTLSGSLVKMYVGDEYKDGVALNVYVYDKDNNKLTLVSEKVVVTNGNVELNLKEYGEYFVTRSTIVEKVEETETPKKEFKFDLRFVVIIETAIIVILAAALIIFRKK